MTRNDMAFFAGFATFLAGAAIYIFVARGTLWALPAIIVVLCGMALVIVAATQDRYGHVSTSGIVRVLLYTIGVNIAGSVLFGLFTIIQRAIR